ncbi:aminoacyl-tRNA hydrolase [Gracilinema caldarium]|uniref:Peptidyl-tRNA hydrolase n=1 Tax=Gracilinema caldarium (strain ATCC 51460 / DSM 7334 / H1) TaxID=744872 RepID=F8F4E7_GRAC1|nr:aminoacyl-tRNA hydrolase [Gracilinema caldarium]AEJ20594.1 Peptidyl-tRNA hydrolase [Gracilinema caldarium DSM 7334]
MIELIIFLGNHGKEYQKNRHNAGWLLWEASQMASYMSLQKKFKSQYGSIDYGKLKNLRSLIEWQEKGKDLAVEGSKTLQLPESHPDKIHCLLPETYMNRSGDAVIEAVTFYKIKPENILVVHDELELPLGTVSCKFSGGLGGHNGLRSIKAHVGTADFWRLRIGIGRPEHNDIASYVLSDFSRDEMPVLEQVLAVTSLALEYALVFGPEVLLPAWNKRRLT